MGFTQEINVTHPNTEKLFSAINLLAVYRDDDLLYIVSELLPNENKEDIVEPVLVSQTIQVFFYDVDHAFEKLQDCFIFPKGLHEATMSQDDLKKKLEKAVKVYGKDVLADGQQLTIITRQQLQTINIEWLKRLVLGNFFIGTSVAMNGIFALQRFGKNVSEVVSNLFKRPGV